MSFTVLSSNILKLGAQPSLFVCEGIWKTSKGALCLIPLRSIKSKAFKEKIEKPPPFPYKEKNFALWRRMFDYTSARFDENSKIIVVDGPIAIGKTKFAKQLAADLDMYHIPDANMDLRYIHDNGFDERSLDGKVPPSVESFDEKKFCKNPTHFNAAAFQIWMYRLRYSLYIDALAHVLSTGQGVVIERSPWSDKAFLEAMAKSNYITKEARRGYYFVKKHTLHHLLRPHLIIYLDAPVSVVKENIKKRGRPYEQNSPALTDKFLQDIEDIYKTDVLMKLSVHAELLMYDWSEPGEVEAIVEDIERLDYGSLTKYDEKCSDWFIRREQIWGDLRQKYADKKHHLLMNFNVPFYDAPELVVSGEDLETFNNIFFSQPETKYAEGFNPTIDKNILFKTSQSKYIKF